MLVFVDTWRSAPGDDAACMKGLVFECYPHTHYCSMFRPLWWSNLTVYDRCGPRRVHGKCVLGFEFGLRELGHGQQQGQVYVVWRERIDPT